MAMERTPMTSRDVLWVALPILPNPGPVLAQDAPPRGPGGAGAPFRHGQGTHPPAPAPAPWAAAPALGGPHGLLPFSDFASLEGGTSSL
jgi:hypothetical protein